MNIDSNTVIAIDVSGAMPPEYIEKLARLVERKRQCSMREIKVLLAGSRVHKLIYADMLDRCGVCGGGGNDFGATFDHIKELDLKPSSLLYLTDGLGCYPCNPPDYPVIWCMVDEHGMQWPPWGEIFPIFKYDEE